MKAHARFIGAHSTRFAILTALHLALTGIAACETDSDGDGYTEDEGDCDDSDPGIYPGATETCDGVDNDCDTTIDEGFTRTWYRDGDADGYGVSYGVVTETCTRPDGYSPKSKDCDDTDPTRFPGAGEVCDARDNDCDGAVDEGDPPGYVDAEGDGFGRGVAVPCSSSGASVVADRGDCNDAVPSIHPGAPDADADGIDQDCGGTTGPEPHVRLSGGSLSSIQAALDAATAGSTIWVGGGGFAEHDLSFRGKPVSLRSTRLATGTVIDALELGRGFVFDSEEGSASVLEGFTITGGYAENGAGAFISGASPTLVDCAFTGNETLYLDGVLGGGVSLEDSGASLTGCSFSRNAAQGPHWVADVPSGGGLALKRSNLTMTDCQVIDNESGDGAGIFVQDSTLVLIRSEVLENYSVIDFPTLDIGGSGTGIRAENTVLDIQDSQISDNYTSEGTGVGISAANGTLTIDRSIIANNTGATYGGGLFIGGVTAVLTHTAIIHNDAGYGGTGGVHSDDSDVTLQSCVISSNFGAELGGAVFTGGALRLLHSVIARNTAYWEGSVAGLVIGDGVDFRIDHSIIAYNLTSYTGYNASFGKGANPLDVTWSDLYNPPDENNHNLPFLGQGSVTLEPGFLTYGSSMPTELHLALTSPLVNAGDPALQDIDGSRADIGIFGGPDGALWDLDLDGLPTWFWPGTYQDVPQGIDASSYDMDTVPM